MLGMEDYAVENTAKEYEVESILTIHNATEDDFGVYSCTMENELGTDTKDILLIDGGIFNQ